MITLYFLKKIRLKKIFHRAFPHEFHGDVDSIIDQSLFQSAHPNTKKFLLRGKIIIIPIRAYVEEPSIEKWEKLSKRQRVILGCILTLHPDGHIREKYVKYLLGHAEEYFIIPYIYGLIGESVVEILESISIGLEEKHIEKINTFKEENTVECEKIESRIISYWNAYYRYPNPENTGKEKYITPNYREYIGHKLLQKIHHKKYPISS